MKRYAALIAFALAANGAAFAQYGERTLPQGTGSLFQGTKEEQAACSPDATKFCLDDMPDNMRVLACLQKNRQKLHKACQRVLEAHGQ